MKVLHFYWHSHDDVLVEPVVELIHNRRAFIRKNKLPDEAEIHLRLLKRVRGKLPDAVIRAGATWGGFNIGLAESTYYKSLQAHRAEIEALHAEECPDCPWDGRTIFPKEAAASGCTITTQAAEIARLRALVAVGDEMARLLEMYRRDLDGCTRCGTPNRTFGHRPGCDLVTVLAKWRELVKGTA